MFGDHLFSYFAISFASSFMMAVLCHCGRRTLQRRFTHYVNSSNRVSSYQDIVNISIRLYGTSVHSHKMYIPTNTVHEHDGDEQTKQPQHYQRPECTICFDTIQIPWRLPCEHVYCYSCIAEWARRSNTCPCCRTKIYDEPKRSGTNLVAQAIIAVHGSVTNGTT